MRRFLVVLVLAMGLGVVAMSTTATHVHAACIPNWQTVQTKAISVLDHFVYVQFGSVSLQRDGCGDIQAQVRAYGDGGNATGGSLTITNVTTNTTVYTSTNLQGHGAVRTIASPIFAGYGGIGITVTGSLTVPSYGTVTQTTNADYGT